MSYREMIQRRADLRNEGNALLAQAERTEEQSTRLDAIAGELETLQASIEKEEKAREALRTADAQVTGRVPAQVREQPEGFKTLGEQLQAVKRFAVTGGMEADNRLHYQAVPTGMGETVGSEGGFLLQPQFASGILAPMHDVAPFTSRVRRLPVGANSISGTINGIDESSRATGSRWGGIRGYRLAEAGSLTASQPKFKQLNWRLKKYGVLVYATDELLADTSQLDAVIRQGAGEELAFMVNDDIFSGDGAAGCLGIMRSGALITVVKEQGQAAGSIVPENLSKMWGRMAPRSKASAVWFVNSDTAPQLDVLSVSMGLGGQTPNFVAYGPDGVLRIKGRPVVETEFNETVGTVGDIMLADLGEYLFWDKDGVQVASSIHVQFLTDQQVFRFIYRAEGQPAWAAPMTPYKGAGNTISPFVVLATRA